VQSFIGAMTGGGCRKGVFVTSSTFTAEAKSYANELRDMKLVLIDGKKLAELMIQHEVGVQVKSTYRISKVDHDSGFGYALIPNHLSGFELPLPLNACGWFHHEAAPSPSCALCLCIPASPRC